jgi:argininosuccinate synthase
MAAILERTTRNWYGMLFHEGQFLILMRNIETFLAYHTVNGKVTVTLNPIIFA